MTNVLITDYDAAMSWIKRAYPYVRRMKEGMEKPLMVAPEMYDALCDLVQEAEKWMMGKSDEAKNEHDKKIRMQCAQRALDYFRNFVGETGGWYEADEKRFMEAIINHEEVEK